MGSPSLWKEQTPTGSSGHWKPEDCGHGSSKWLVLSCDSSSPLPRPPCASSEELMKSAGCGQPRCSAGMFWSQLLTRCFAYCVSNTTCFYMLRVNKGKGLSAQNEVLIGAVSDPAAPRCAVRTLRGYSCIIPALLLHSAQPFPPENHPSSFSNHLPLAEPCVLLSSAQRGLHRIHSQDRYPWDVHP